MSKDIPSTIEHVNFDRWTNKARNAYQEIGRIFLQYAYILKEIKEKGYYEYRYESFKEYCNKELSIDPSTTYDYIKIATFVKDNRKYIPFEKAEVPGHKRLKILSQKLSRVELKLRKAVLKNIHEYDNATKIKEKVQLVLKR